jgi:AGZA family xanthine/uracil permease-like MFS transporter
MSARSVTAGATVERLFRLRERGTSVRTEVLGGLTTFATMAYIVFVNPAVLSQTGMDFGAVLTATCIAAGVASWVMALAANYPIAMAPAMGENFFFLTVVLAMGFTWQLALGAVFVSGVTFFALTLLGIRERVIDAIPASLKHAIAVGIGFFIALLGLVGAGVVERPPAGGILHLGDLTRPPTLVACAGLALTVALLARRVRGAILAGVLVATALAWMLGLVRWQGLTAPPPSLAPTFLALDLRALARPDAIPVVLVFLFMAVFDAIGTLVAIGEQGGFFRGARLPRIREALLADSAGTVLGSLLGTATVTAYVESAAGVEAGARTGLASLVTGACFFLALFFAPLARMVGGGVAVDGGGVLQPLTAPALVVVGSLMARSATRIAWSDLTEAFPAFLVMVGIPFTWSIADGIAFGFISYPALKLLSGRAREASPLMYVLGALFVARYALL